MNLEPHDSDHDLAVSYASEDKALVHAIIACLSRRVPRLRVFCYGLTGRLPDEALESHLEEVFGNSRRTVLFVSNYFWKPLTLVEFRRIFGRFRTGKMHELLLVRLGDLDLPELPSTYSWVDLRLTTIPVLVERLLHLFDPVMTATENPTPIPFDPLWQTIALSQGLADGLEGMVVATDGLLCRRARKPREENEPDVLVVEEGGVPAAFVSFEVESRTDTPALIIRSGEYYDEWPRPIDAFAYAEWNQELWSTVMRVYDIGLVGGDEAEMLLTFDELLETVASRMVGLINERRVAQGPSM